ncbi:starvation-inducible DNA-binding protein [Aliiruegeria haliotis]|uniref:Starvation-inducible DNA-binding protein n=1 Tax=Aliiruegeria haliotis TaxID=1280846 RepID=A0A2T0RPK2_9RHOB|nr:DNA starvation/stationary phase protection protein [Aliiruegeria haliotis]PRY23125.1 starvation-inducible DNA-binding protein [Aliiruegeria haliotis]
MNSPLNIAPSNPMNIAPSDKVVKTGVRDVDAVAEGLADVLSESYAVLLKTHSYHWNVEGPLFHAVHVLTEEHYTDLFAAIDVIAERIRALGRVAPMKPSDVVNMSNEHSTLEHPSALWMLEDLAKDNERLAHKLHALVELADARKDHATADLATARIAVHEKAVWMLRALAAS